MEPLTTEPTRRTAVLLQVLAEALIVLGIAAAIILAPWVEAGSVAGYAAMAVILGGAVLLFFLVRRLKESETRTRTIVETAADGIITVSDQGQIESFNRAAEGIFGYRSGQIIGENIATLFPSSYQEVEDGDFTDFLDANGIRAGGTPHEGLGLRRDGETFHMDFSVCEATLGNKQMFTAVVRDITERIHARQALSRAKEELEMRVEERTASLKHANEQLRGEIDERKRIEAQREKVLGELQEALAKIKTLRGLIPICASCKRVRDDQGYWNQIEVYVRDHSDAEFSHGICPECAKKLYPELEVED